MMDSPVGIAAWLIEKFNSWSDVKNNDIEGVHSKDALLTNIMIYIIILVDERVNYLDELIIIHCRWIDID